MHRNKTIFLTEVCEKHCKTSSTLNDYNNNIIMLRFPKLKQFNSYFT